MHEHRDMPEARKPETPRPVRKQYAKPELTQHGHVRDLTQAGGSQVGDFGTTSWNT